MSEHDDVDFSDFDPTPPGGWNKRWNSLPPVGMKLYDPQNPPKLDFDGWEDLLMKISLAPKGEMIMVRWRRDPEEGMFVKAWLEGSPEPDKWTPVV